MPTDLLLLVFQYTPEILHAARPYEYKRIADKFSLNYLTKLCARHNFLDFFKYLHSQHGSRVVLDSNLPRIAADFNHPRFLEYLICHDAPLDMYVTIAAASKGNLQCLAFAHMAGALISSQTSFCAARGGHLHCLKYLYQHNCPWDTLSTSRAAMNGHLDCLKFLHLHGCPWSSTTTEWAFLCGNLNCLVYAYENGCEFDPRVVGRTPIIDSIACLEYASNMPRSEYYI